MSILCYTNNMFIMKYILLDNIYDLNNFIREEITLTTPKHFSTSHNLLG